MISILHRLCLGLTLLSSSALAETTARPRTVKLVVALMWEGRDLEDYNLDALKAFRAEYTDIQLVHFISPAYFLRNDGSATEKAAKIRELIRPGDRIGLALGGWKSLAARADVIFRNGPTFWGETLRPVDCKDDCGQDVPVHVYPAEDLEKLVATGLKVLEEQGFGKVKGLSTAGWVASPEVLEAAALAGIRYDFSAVATEMLAKRARLYPIYGWIKGLWPTITPHTQPFVLTTASAGLTEVPQSIGAVDYVSISDIDTLFREYADLARRDSGRELTFPLSFYQETAQANLPILKRALTAIFAQASAEGISLQPMELPGMEVSGMQLAMPLTH